MKKIAYTNTGTAMIYIGTVAIHPGATREVDADLLPKPDEAEGKPPVEAGPFEHLLTLSVKEIIEQLPALTAEELALLSEAETNGRNRTSLLTAITKRQLELSQPD